MHFFLGRCKSRICKIFSCWDRNPVYRVYHQITDDPGQGCAPGSPVHSKAISGTVAIEGPWTTEDKIGQPCPCCFTRSKYPKPWNTTSGGPSLTVLPWGTKNKLSVLELLPSHCQHFQFHLPLTKCNFLFLKKKPKELFEGFTDSLRRLHGQQTTLSKQQFDELSVNGSETYGLHFWGNTHGFAM